MASINFPDNPALQSPVDTFSPTSTPDATTNGATYIWDGTVWKSSSVGFVPSSGGTITGNLIVDGVLTVNTDSSFTENLGVTGNVTAAKFIGDGSDLTNLPKVFSFKGAIDVTAQAPASPENGDFYLAAAAGVVNDSFTGIAGLSVNENQIIVYNSSSSRWFTGASAAPPGTYLPMSGGTITGDLTVTDLTSGSNALYTGNIQTGDVDLTSTTNAGWKIDSDGVMYSQVTLATDTNLDVWTVYKGTDTTFRVTASGSSYIGSGDEISLLSDGDITSTGTIEAAFLKGDGSQLTNVPPTGVTGAAGANTQVQYNNNGDFGASSSFIFNGETAGEEFIDVPHIQIERNGLIIDGVAYLGTAANLNQMNGSVQGEVRAYKVVSVGPTKDIEGFNNVGIDAVLTLSLDRTNTIGAGPLVFAPTNSSTTWAMRQDTADYLNFDCNTGTYGEVIWFAPDGGATFSGQVTIPATPVDSTDAASKGYVDSAVSGEDYWQEASNMLYPQDTSDGIAIGVNSPGNPSISLNNDGSIDAVGTITANLFSGPLPYSDLTGTPIIPTNNNQLTNGAGYYKSGDSPSFGQVTIPETPDADTSATSKKYVDDSISASGAGTVTSITADAPLTGGTITGSGSIGIEPASGSTAGSMSLADFNKLSTIPSDATNNTGTVTSVGSGNGLTGGSITSTGTLAVVAANTTINVAESGISVVEANLSKVPSATNADTLDGKTASTTSVDTIVLRDGSGNFSAGTITANLFSGPLPYSDLTGTPTIPTNNNQLINGAGYITSSGTSGDADKLDGQEGTYYLDYDNFTNTPTIPTNNNQLTNGAGYYKSGDDVNLGTITATGSGSFLGDVFTGTTKDSIGNPGVAAKANGYLRANSASTDASTTLFYLGTAVSGVVGGQAAIVSGNGDATFAGTVAADGLEVGDGNFEIYPTYSRARWPVYVVENGYTPIGSVNLNSGVGIETGGLVEIQGNSTTANQPVLNVLWQKNGTPVDGKYPGPGASELMSVLYQDGGAWFRGHVSAGQISNDALAETGVLLKTNGYLRANASTSTATDTVFYLGSAAQSQCYIVKANGDTVTTGGIQAGDDIEINDITTDANAIKIYGDGSYYVRTDNSDTRGAVWKAYKDGYSDSATTSAIYGRGGAWFQQTVEIGNTFGTTGNIVLNNDGSVTGTAFYRDTLATNGGINLSAGQCYIRQDGSNAVFQVYSGGDQTANVTANIKGDGTINSGNLSTGNGSRLNPTGTIEGRVSSSGAAFTIYNGGTSADKIYAQIDGDGNYTAKGTITLSTPGTNGYIAFFRSNGGSDDAVIIEQPPIGETAAAVSATMRVAKGQASTKNSIATAGPIYVGGFSATAASKGLWLRDSGTVQISTNSTEGNAVQVINTGVDQVRLLSNGKGIFTNTVSAQGSVLTSDQRFKANLTDAKSQLTDVVALGNSLKNWDWTDDAPVSDKDVRFLGLVAQDVEAICPALVTTTERTKNGAELTPAVTELKGPNGNVIREAQEATYEQLDDSYKGIKNDVLIMKLLGAVAELKAEVEALKAAM